MTISDRQLALLVGVLAVDARRHWRAWKATGSGVHRVAGVVAAGSIAAALAIVPALLAAVWAALVSGRSVWLGAALGVVVAAAVASVVLAIVHDEIDPGEEVTPLRDPDEVDWS